MPKNSYTIVVGNVGQVYHGSNKKAALTEFDAWVDASVAGGSRAGSEDVTLFANDDIIKEFQANG